MTRSMTWMTPFEVSTSVVTMFEVRARLSVMTRVGLMEKFYPWTVFGWAPGTTSAFSTRAPSTWYVSTAVRRGLLARS